MLNSEQMNIAELQAPILANQMLNAVPIRVFDEEIVEQSEVCPFCDNSKITSGTWLQVGSFGTPCCWSCYVKA